MIPAQDSSVSTLLHETLFLTIINAVTRRREESA